MNGLAPFIIGGLVAGSLYGLAATGLVLTYKTSGVFNFAHGAVGSAAAYLFYDLRNRQHVPALLAALVTAGIAAPLLGLLLSLLAARLSKASTAQRVVATIGVLLLIEGVIELRYGITPRLMTTSLPSSTFRVLGINVGYDQLITMIIAVAGVVGLEVLFRRSRLGLQMRAVVDNEELLDLAGQAPAVVRAQAWMIGSAFAAVSGILLAPTVGLDAVTLTLVVVQAFGAAAVGRFDRTSTTFAAGVGIGVLQSLMDAPRVHRLAPFLNHIEGLDQAVPFIVLFAVLILTPAGRFRDLSLGRAPRPRSDTPRRLVAAAGVAALVVGIAAPVLAPTKLPVFTLGAVFITVYASLFLLVEVSNQVSLCHVAFVALGATTFCQVTGGLHVPWLVGVLIAGLVVVPVGAFVAIPAIRLSGLFLALATLGFGILVEKLFYLHAVMFGGFGVRVGHRPDVPGLNGARGYYLLCLAVGIGAIGLVRVIQRARLGRLLSGVADTPVALSTSGASINVTRVLVFCISAFMAGVAGALYVGVVGSVSATGASGSSLVSFNALTWLAVLAFVGRNTFASPVLAAVALVVAPSYITNPHITQYLTICFGIAAIAATAYGDGLARYFATAAPRGLDRVRRSPVRERTMESNLA
jgi:branched-subunit amino acid ABC-type transport system permease component